jgi:hypothetical protein
MLSPAFGPEVWTKSEDEGEGACTANASRVGVTTSTSATNRTTKLDLGRKPDVVVVIAIGSEILRVC